MAGEIEDLNSRDAQTVCDGLGRYEDTLRGAVREIHVDIQLFKQGVGRQVEEVLRLASPLAHAVSELQQENRRLRVQLERLSRQVEALGRSAGLSQEWVNEAAESPQVVGPGSPRQGSADGTFSSHAKLAVTGRSQSVDLEDHQKPEFRRVFSSSIIENGHRSSSSGQAKVAHELTCFQMSESSPPEAHAPAVTLQMPHLPVTAVTRTSEKFSGENICPTGATNTSFCLPGQGKSTNAMGVKSSNQPVKNWNSITTRTTDSSATGENATSVTKSVSAVNYGLCSGAKTGESADDSYCDATPSSHSPPPTVHHQVERRRELVRSQTLPRTTGTQARKALFEKLERDGKGKGESRAKLKRSLSFGVASASSIKQILLDWCRSKTIGYKHIDLQNFSSSWNDGMAFCALVHSFFPEAFDYNKLDPANRKQNFELAFTTAEKMAHCDRLIEVEDMMVMGHKPDPMCVFTYVQSLYSHLRCFE
ncbi:PREDICTED: smoothelin-like protein 2 isoform X2 [Pseudopodoces humilis]|uniref:smoothelin-like protein 2 isoform X2 n=1 Tax=Pseudopodoces humilis TaxID=181119 RepID=UPI0006B7B0CB|nr:PREDICTED: smoothelin-like protein 2 isoform X2 [Pseudopodoces humilis]